MGTVWADVGGGALVYDALFSWLDIGHVSVWMQHAAGNQCQTWTAMASCSKWMIPTGLCSLMNDAYFGMHIISLYDADTFETVKLPQSLFCPISHPPTLFPTGPICHCTPYIQNVYSLYIHTQRQRQRQSEGSCSPFLCIIQWKVGQRGGESGPTKSSTHNPSRLCHALYAMLD